MNRYKNIILMLGLCVVFARCVQAEDANDSIEQEQALTIALTEFDVNETTLKLSWKIMNNTDHDIWICDSISERNWEYLYVSDFEAFIAEDDQTLVLSWRLDKPLFGFFSTSVDFVGRYFRLRAGQERSEFETFPLPFSIFPYLEYDTGDAPYATRLAIEIGYYDEDLPGLIQQIVDIARRLNCESIDFENFEEYARDYKILDRYFGGLLIEKAFSEQEDFRESTMSGGDEIILPYISEFYNVGEHILDEQILRLEIDGVYIPMN